MQSVRSPSSWFQNSLADSRTGVHPGYSLRRSNLKNLSIRRNRINATSAVAVALIIRDYPDNRPTATAANNGNTNGEALFLRLNQDIPRAGTPDAMDVERDLPLPPVHPWIGYTSESEKLGSLVTLDVKGNDIRVSCGLNILC